MKHNIVLHWHNAALNIGTVNRATLMQLLTVQCYNNAILNSATMAITITTNTTATSAI